MAGFFDFMANPTRFQAIAGRFAASAFYLCYLFFIWALSVLICLASRLSARRGGANYVCPCSVCMDRIIQLFGAEGFAHFSVGVAPSPAISLRVPCGSIGAGFAGLTLITGSLWGYPIWGTWWVWDTRLTSMLVLFFFFIGYIALANGFERPERGARMAAILALVGCINLPIVKFSVDWWNTLHQPASILRSGGIAIDSSMLWPLMMMFAGFQCLFYLDCAASHGLDAGDAQAGSPAK